MASLHRRLRDDERGMAIVFVAVGLMTLVTATTLAIDVGMLMTARTQAQNSADAGALAGAVALTIDDFNDRSINGPVVQSAVAAAKAAGNSVMGQAVAIEPADVTFPVGPTGVANRVQIRVSRSAARGNPLSTLLAGMFGADHADVGAAATAEATPANAATCLTPFAIPDRWIEGSPGGWDPNDTFNGYAATQKDIYRDVSLANYSGYNVTRDKGLQLRLTVGAAAAVRANNYYRVDLPNSSTGDDFEENISGCNHASSHFGDMLAHEPGNYAAETREAIQDLIDRDPGAYWDAANNRVAGGQNPSPRVRLLPVFDPMAWNTAKNAGRNYEMKAANYIGIFIEGIAGDEITARICPITGVADQAAPAAPSGSFARAIRLVQ
jgi:hypothetical protein